MAALSPRLVKAISRSGDGRFAQGRSNYRLLNRMFDTPEGGLVRS
jgi:hypothetical protein